MGSSSDQVQFREYYQNWMIEQQQLLEELVQVHRQNPNDEQELCCIIEKLIKHFQDYSNRRAQFAVNEPSSVFSPTWCTSTENSYLWFGGCRPSLLIQIVNTLSGSQLESQHTEYFEEVRTGNMGGLSANQLSLVSELKCRTTSEEERLSTKMDSLQESIVDCPLTRLGNINSVGSDAESHFGLLKQALDSHSKELSSILIDSDKLRMNTMKELISIFTPLQAVEFLIAGKKLHLCMHQWGQLRDHIPDMEAHDGEGM